MSHLTDVIEETKNEIIRRSNHDATDQWKDPGEVAEYVDKAMTKAALAVIEEIKKNSEEAVPRLWYVSESTFETLKAILTTPKE